MDVLPLRQFGHGSGALRVLSRDQIKCLIEGTKQDPSHALALKRGGCHAQIDQRLRDAVPGGLGHKTGPDVLFRPQRKIWAPMVQKSAIAERRV